MRVADPDLIGRLIARATEELAARIDGPRWLISPGNSVHLEAARQAAADALRRAQAYAEGVGAKLGRVIRLAEADIGYVRRAASAPRAVAAAEPIAVEAGEHDVMASVEATFTLEID